MNKIEVRSNTGFSQLYCACLQKMEFCRHKTQEGKIIHNVKRNGFLYSSRKKYIYIQILVTSAESSNFCNLGLKRKKYN